MRENGGRGVIGNNIPPLFPSYRFSPPLQRGSERKKWPFKIFSLPPFLFLARQLLLNQQHIWESGGFFFSYIDRPATAAAVINAPHLPSNKARFVTEPRRAIYPARVWEKGLSARVWREKSRWKWTYSHPEVSMVFAPGENRRPYVF